VAIFLLGVTCKAVRDQRKLMNSKKNKIPGFMPVCLKLDGEICLVIGGGKVAQRKIIALIKFGTDIVCISPEVTARIQTFIDSKKIKYIKRRYSDKISIKRYKLIVAATADPVLNTKISKRAARENILVNVVTARGEGDIMFPAILRKKDVIIGVSTGGKSPSRAKSVRDSINNVI